MYRLYVDSSPVFGPTSGSWAHIVDSDDRAEAERQAHEKARRVRPGIIIKVFPWPDFGHGPIYAVRA